MSDKEKFVKLSEKKTHARDELKLDYEKNVSDHTLQKHFDELMNAKKDYAELCFKKHLEIRKILTPEQRKKLHELKKDEKDSDDETSSG